MNKAIMIGRLTKDADVRYTNDGKAIARYTLAVDRRFKREGEQSADFINCVAFGKAAEFAEKYLKQGIKIAVDGRIQTGSYTKQDGTRVYTTDVIIENQEFVERKADRTEMPPSQPDDFVSVPDNINSDELPFA